MGIVNRRNAIFGWMALQVAKRVLKQKARSAMPGIAEDSRRPNTPAMLLAALALLGGALWFWFSRDDDDYEFSDPSSP